MSPRRAATTAAVTPSQGRSGNGRGPPRTRPGASHPRVREEFPRAAALEPARLVRQPRPVYHAAVSGEFRMAEATLTAYRQLRFRANARPRVVIVPIGFVCWDDEYPAGEPPIPSGDPAAYDTLAELYAARGHYWEMGMIPDQFQELWHTTHEQMPNWPGF